MAGAMDQFGGITSALSRAHSPRGLVAVAELILVIILAVLLSKIAIALFAPLPVPSGAVVASAPTAARSLETGPVLNPFPETPVTAIADTSEVVADTDLNLTLMGTWAEGDGEGSAAIKTPDNKQDRFSVGDEIINNVVLDEVYADHIVINRNGAREALRFETKASAPRQRRAPTPRQPATDPNKINNRGLLDIIRIAPGRDIDGATTVELYASRNRAAFSRLQLKNGDVLQSIDGEPIPTDPSQLVAKFEELKNAGSVTLEVKRDNEIIPITIGADLLSAE